jgi:general secretion pathway protein G
MKLGRNRKPQFGRSLTHHGFTLVEMLIVLVILSTLAAIVYPSYINKGLRARRTAAMTQIKVLKTALAAFEMDNDHFPQGHNGLQELVQRPRDAQNWRGPYLDGNVPKDPWGHDYLYECPGKHNQPYDIICLAQDGLQGTDDDITTWQQENQ